MIAFPEALGGLRGPGDEGPSLPGDPSDADEQRARRAAQAAQWRAHALAGDAFGTVVSMRLGAIRASGPLRGLLRLDVPFADLDDHRRREARFLDAVAADDVLTETPLLYVIGPHVGDR